MENSNPNSWSSHKPDNLVLDNDLKFTFSNGINATKETKPIKL